MVSAIYGGTFDPIHLGHYGIIQYLVNQGYQQVIVMPTGLPLHKDHQVTDSRHRLAMLKLALSNLSSKLIISTLEINRPGATDTIDTIYQVLSDSPDSQLVFCLGSDSFMSLRSWPEWRELIRLIRFEVFIRGNDSRIVEKIGHFSQLLYARYNVKPGTIQYNIADLKLPNISSTDIRGNLKELGQKYLDPRVLEYIKENQLYV